MLKKNIPTKNHLLGGMLTAIESGIIDVVRILFSENQDVLNIFWNISDNQPKKLKEILGGNLVVLLIIKLLSRKCGKRPKSSTLILNGIEHFRL